MDGDNVAPRLPDRDADSFSSIIYQSSGAGKIEAKLKQLNQLVSTQDEYIQELEEKNQRLLDIAKSKRGSDVTDGSISSINDAARALAPLKQELDAARGREAGHLGEISSLETKLRDTLARVASLETDVRLKEQESASVSERQKSDAGSREQSLKRDLQTEQARVTEAQRLAKSIRDDFKSAKSAWELERSKLIDLARQADAEATRRAQATQVADARVRQTMEGSRIEAEDAAERSRADVAAEAARWQGVVRSLGEELQSARRAVERRDAELRGQREAFSQEVSAQRALHASEQTASHSEREALRDQLEGLRRVSRRKDSAKAQEVQAMRAQLDSAVLSAAQNEAALQDRARDLMQRLAQAEKRAIEAAGGMEPHQAIEEQRRLHEKLAEALRARDDAVRAAMQAREDAGGAAERAAESQSKEAELVRREAAARVKLAEDRAEAAEEAEQNQAKALEAARIALASRREDESTRSEALEREVTEARSLAEQAGASAASAARQLQAAEKDAAELQQAWDAERAGSREAEGRRSRDKDEQISQLEDILRKTRSSASQEVAAAREREHAAEEEASQLRSEVKTARDELSKARDAAQRQADTQREAAARAQASVSASAAAALLANEGRAEEVAKLAAEVQALRDSHVASASKFAQRIAELGRSLLQEREEAEAVERKRATDTEQVLREHEGALQRARDLAERAAGDARLAREQLQRREQDWEQERERLRADVQAERERHTASEKQRAEAESALRAKERQEQQVSADGSTAGQSLSDRKDERARSLVALQAATRDATAAADAIQRTSDTASLSPALGSPSDLPTTGGTNAGGGGDRVEPWVASGGRAIAVAIGIAQRALEAAQSSKLASEKERELLETRLREQDDAMLQHRQALSDAEQRVTDAQQAANRSQEAGRRRADAETKAEDEAVSALQAEYEAVKGLRARVASEHRVAGEDLAAALGEAHSRHSAAARRLEAAAAETEQAATSYRKAVEGGVARYEAIAHSAKSAAIDRERAAVAAEQESRARVARAEAAVRCAEEEAIRTDEASREAASLHAEEAQQLRREIRRVTAEGAERDRSDFRSVEAATGELQRFVGRRKAEDEAMQRQLKDAQRAWEETVGRQLQATKLELVQARAGAEATRSAAQERERVVATDMANVQAGLSVLRKMEQERENSVVQERSVTSSLLGRLESYCEQVEAVSVEDRRELQGEIEQLRREMAEREAALARESNAMRSALDSAMRQIRGPQQGGGGVSGWKSGDSARSVGASESAQASIRQATAVADAAAAAAAQAQAERLKEHNENLSAALASARDARQQADATTLQELRRIRAAFRSLNDSQAKQMAGSGGASGLSPGSPGARRSSGLGASGEVAGRSFALGPPQSRNSNAPGTMAQRFTPGQLAGSPPPMESRAHLSPDRGRQTPGSEPVMGSPSRTDYQDEHTGTSRAVSGAVSRPMAEEPTSIMLAGVSGPRLDEGFSDGGDEEDDSDTGRAEASRIQSKHGVRGINGGQEGNALSMSQLQGQRQTSKSSERNGDHMIGQAGPALPVPQGRQQYVVGMQLQPRQVVASSRTDRASARGERGTDQDGVSLSQVSRQGPGRSSPPPRRTRPSLKQT